MAREVPITLQNQTDVDQRVWVGEHNHEVTLHPHEVRPVSQEIAAAFLADRARFVREYDGVVCNIQKPGEPLVWIANVTGNPFLPKILKETRVVKGREELFERVNPLTIPTVFSQQASRGMRVEDEDDAVGGKSYHLGFATIAIPPFVRCPLPYSIADWLLLRDARQDAGHQGKIVHARPPREDGFEPNMTWSFDDMRLYANIIDSREIVTTDKAAMGIGAADVYATNVELETAKVDLYRMLFFRLVDDKYALPDRNIFEVEKTRRDKAVSVEPAPSNLPPVVEEKLHINLDRADKRLEKKRGPGRPRKE